MPPPLDRPLPGPGVESLDWDSFPVSGVRGSDQDEAGLASRRPEHVRRLDEFPHPLVPQHPRREHNHRDSRRLGRYKKRGAVDAGASNHHAHVLVDQTHPGEVRAIVRVLKDGPTAWVAQGHSPQSLQEGAERLRGSVIGREDVAEPTDGVHHGGITHEAGSDRAIDHGLDGAVMDQQRLLSPVQLEQEREGARFTQRVERAPGDR